MQRKRPLKPKFEAARDDTKQVPEEPKDKQPGAYKDLTKKVGPVFDQARNWAAEQRQKLTDEQRRNFDELKKERKKEEKKKRKAMAATKARLAEETNKRSSFDLDLTPRNRPGNWKLVRIGKQLNRQRTELKKYLEKRQKIETQFLKRPEGNRVPKEARKETQEKRAKKPVIRRARRRRSRDRGDADRSR